MHNHTKTSILAVFLLLATGTAQMRAEDWKKELEHVLPLLGHRNWIVVADSAYPWQTAPGIEMVYAGGDQIEVLSHVLQAIEKAKHVRADVLVDSELPHVPENLAPGMAEYRRQLEPLLEGRGATSLPHEQIIERLDEAGQTFHVLLIKTDLTLPYTSVFIQLQAGYWSDEAERQLRESIRQAEQPGENSSE